jgi:hypothetical protein
LVIFSMKARTESVMPVISRIQNMGIIMGGPPKTGLRTAYHFRNNAAGR